MSAKDYPITFPYGATSPPYGTAALPYHRGDDRAMPSGTPVIVNGTQIGLSGNSGFSTGAHLHIGRFVGGADTNPNGQGFNLTPPVKVLTVASDATNGNYVRLLDGNGVAWVYLHLSAQTVATNQYLAGGNMADKVDVGTARILAEDILGRDRTKAHAGGYDADLNANHVGKDLSNAYIYSLWTSPEANATVSYRNTLQSFYSTYKDKIAELSARPTKEQLAQLGKDLDAEHQKVVEAEKKLAEEQAKKSDDTVLLDEAGGWFTKLWNRLFKKG